MVHDVEGGEGIPPIGESWSELQRSAIHTKDSHRVDIVGASTKAVSPSPGNQ